MTRLYEAEKLIDSIFGGENFWNPLSDIHVKSLVAKLKNNEELAEELRRLLNHNEWENIHNLFAKRNFGEPLIRENLEKERLLIDQANQEWLRKMQRSNERSAIFQEITNRFNSNFLSADIFYQDACTDIITEKEFKEFKLSFVKTWIAENARNSKNDSVQA